MFVTYNIFGNFFNEFSFLFLMWIFSVEFSFLYSFYSSYAYFVFISLLFCFLSVSFPDFYTILFWFPLFCTESCFSFSFTEFHSLINVNSFSIYLVSSCPLLYLLFSHSFLSVICSLFFIYFLSSFHSHSFSAKCFLSDICFSYSSSSFFLSIQPVFSNTPYLSHWVSNFSFLSVSFSHSPLLF